MEIPVVLTIILTVLSPYATAFFNRVTWSPETKHLVTIAVSIVIAVLYLIVSGSVGDWSALAVVIPMVYTLQQLVYKFILKDSVKSFELNTTSQKYLDNLDKVSEGVKTEETPVITELVTSTDSKG